jgi:FtsZ-binding cell division protein ZapB
MSETTHNYSNKVLYIPDFILPQHIAKVYDYFKTFNIAKLKNVQVFDHSEPEYNCEDRAYYCYAIIIVDEWYNNPDSYSFYKSIEENRCKMVYDDPKYWDLEFYEGEDLQKEENEKVTIKIEEFSIPPPPPVSLNKSFESENENNEHNEDDEHDEENDSEDSFEENDSEDSFEENDDPNDETYEFSDSENEEDQAFEYYIKYEKKKISKSKKTNVKKRKYNSEVEALKEENNELKELLIKRNKNYLKNNKKKPEKNVWSRRLRAKIS